MKRVAYVLLGLSLLVLCGGCTAAAVGAAGAAGGAGTYAYIKGELQNTYGIPLEQTWTKTLLAMEDLRLTVDHKEVDVLGGAIDARRADGTPVKIRLKPKGEGSTVIGVRVGSIESIWSKDQAERIHHAIQERLGV